MLFGTGSPAGIVNQSTTQAVLNKRQSQLQYRVGSFGSYRASVSTNQPLGSKAAVFVAALYDSPGYERKPSYNVTRRQFVTLDFEPTSKTKITADFENYDNHNSLPNFVAPLDYVTPWKQAGRPAYNPITSMLTILDTGQVIGPYLASTLDPRWTPGLPVGTSQMTNSASSLFVPTIALEGHTKMYIDQNNVVGFWAASPSSVSLNRPANTSLTGSQWYAYTQELTSSVAPLAPLPAASTGATSYGTWYPVSITNKALYDWTKTSLDSANYDSKKAKTYHFEFQQQLPWGFNLDAGWFRQEYTDWSNQPLGSGNNPLGIYVDTNLVGLNGQPNPYFGSPYVNNYQSSTNWTYEINNNYRAMLEWEHDFTKNAGWTRWLGRHRVLGFWTRQEDNTHYLHFFTSFDGGDPRLLPNTNTNPANNYSWAGNANNFQRDYYLGKNPDGVVQYSPALGGSGFGMGSQLINVYNWTTNTYDQAQVHLDSNLYYAGSGVGYNYVTDEARSIAWQGYLWKDRILPTLGWRRDNLDIRATSLAGLTNSNQYLDGYAIPGIDSRMGTPLILARNTKTLGVVVKPFQGWDAIDNAAENGNFLADVIRGLSFHLNKSDNFTAPGSIEYDFFGNQLGKPQGKGKDWGVGLSMFHNKLYLNLDWYEADDQNAPSSAAGTPIGRIERVDTSSFRSWADFVVRIRDGQDPTTKDFANNSITPLTQTEQDTIAKMMQLAFDWPTYRVAGTETDKSKGMEASLIYNPMPNWTIKWDVGKQRSTYSDVAKQITDWLAVRMPIWTSAVATDMPALVKMYNGQELSLQHFWTGYGFNADARLTNNYGWTSVQGFYNSAVAPTVYTAIAGQNTQVPNEREWTSNLITNYEFTHGRLKGFSVGGAYRWEDKAIVGYYGSTDPNTYAHPAPGQSVMVLPDINRPIYTPSQTHIDLWIAYATELPKIFGKHVAAKFQFNVRDVTQNGGLLPILYNFDGTPAEYRIMDPRTYFFTTTLTF